MATTRQLCSFRVDDEWFGVDVHEVQEVLRHPATTRIPLAPPELEGLLNLRGQIVAAIDLRRRLGRPERSARRAPMDVVLRGGEGAMSLLVDEIGDVLEVDSERCEPPPPTLPRPARNVIRSVVQLDGRLLLILDVRRVVAIPDADGA